MVLALFVVVRWCWSNQAWILCCDVKCS